MISSSRYFGRLNTWNNLEPYWAGRENCLEGKWLPRKTLINFKSERKDCFALILNYFGGWKRLAVCTKVALWQNFMTCWAKKRWGNSKKLVVRTNREVERWVLEKDLNFLRMSSENKSKCTISYRTEKAGTQRNPWATYRQVQNNLYTSRNIKQSVHRDI